MKKVEISRKGSDKDNKDVKKSLWDFKHGVNTELSWSIINSLRGKLSDNNGKINKACHGNAD